MQLSEPQKKCVRDIHRLFKEHGRVCLAWYTGAGKTNIFLQLCKELVATNPGVKIGISSFFVREIKNQVFERMAEFDLQPVSHKIRPGVNIDQTKNIFVFNPQGLFRREIPFSFDVLIVDEAHAGTLHQSTMIRQILKNKCKRGAKVLLASATPWDLLADKEFKGVPVLKRSLAQGLKDGRVSDYRMNIERAEISFSEEDYSRLGDLNIGAVNKKSSILASVCAGTLKNIIARKSASIGKKCIVICPPGNNAGVARTLAAEFNGLCHVQVRGEHGGADAALESFRSSGEARFLFVVNKCQTGFDMPELDSIVDLSMTRNVSLLAQRCGRIARKHGRKKKNYFYVCGQNMSDGHVEWLISTVVDFSCGNFDGWTTRNSKHRALALNKFRKRFGAGGSTILISEIMSLLERSGAVSEVETLRPVSYAQRKERTLSSAIEEARQYSDRHDLFKKNPSLYKWFRLNHFLDELGTIHPKINDPKAWTVERAIEVMKKCKSRNEFMRKHSYGAQWLKDNNLSHLKDQYLPATKRGKRWSHEEILKIIGNIKAWSHIRWYGGARNYIKKNGGEQMYQNIWKKLNEGGTCGSKTNR